MKMMANYFYALTLPEVSLLIFVARPMVFGNHPDGELVPKRKVTPVPHPTFPFPYDKVYLRGSINLPPLPLHRLYLKISQFIFDLLLIKFEPQSWEEHNPRKLSRARSSLSSAYVLVLRC